MARAIPKSKEEGRHRRSPRSPSKPLALSSCARALIIPVSSSRAHFIRNIAADGRMAAAASWTGLHGFLSNIDHSLGPRRCTSVVSAGARSAHWTGRLTQDDADDLASGNPLPPAFRTAKTDVPPMRPNMARGAQPDTGFIDIHLSTGGKIEDAKIKFHWQENTAPPVVPPTRKDSDSILLETLISRDFGGQPTDIFACQRLIRSTDAVLPMVFARNQQRIPCIRSGYPQSFNCSARTKLKRGGSGNSVPRSCVVGNKRRNEKAISTGSRRRRQRNKPLAYRGACVRRDIYGGARHDDCHRRAALYFGRPCHRALTSCMGRDKLSRRQFNRTVREYLAVHRVREAQFFSDLHCSVYGVFDTLRICTNLTSLLLFRVLQGLAGGGMTPVAQSILADAFPPNKRSQAFAIYGVAVVVAPVVGPVLGGWLSDNWSWNWCFFINGPVGLASLVAIYFLIEDKKKDREERRKMWSKELSFDLVGFILVATFLGGLEVVLDKGQEDDWLGSSFILTFALLSASALVLFIPWALLKNNPIIDVRMLASRQFGACFVVMLGVGAILIATTQMVPQLLQDNYGYTATLSGLALSLGGIVTMVMMIVVGRLNFIQPKYLIATGSAFVAYGMYYLTSLYGDTNFGYFAWSRMIVGVGLPLMFVPITTASYDGLPASKTDQASSLINLARNFGGSIGVSISQTVLARREQFHQSRLAEQVGT